MVISYYAKKRSFVHFTRERQMCRKLFFPIYIVLLFYSFPVISTVLSAESTTGLQSKSASSEQIYPVKSTQEGEFFSPSGMPGTDLVQEDEPIELLFSPSVSQKFYEIAYDLAKAENTKEIDVEEAIIFLTAALNLDKNATDVRSLLIEYASRDPNRDYSKMVYNLLVDYVNESADLEVAMKGITYLLGRADSIEEREALISNMLGSFGNRNAVLGSELATMLGFLDVEKPDLKAAEYYFSQAYQNNAYNSRAFIELTKIAPSQISDEVYFERLRLALRENPTDIDSAIAFAQYTEKFQLYEVASGAYKYCADLFMYLYPNEVLPSRIYLPWAINCYNTPKKLSKCLEIAELIREKDKFDLILESIAGKAALKLGDGDLATQILQNASQKARLLARRQNVPGASEEANTQNFEQFDISQLAWFYCFVIPLEDRALTWAKEAYSNQPNSTTASILAYAHIINNEIQEARDLIESHESNQISDLALAKIQIAEDQDTEAIRTLQASIARDPGTFEAECAKDILSQMGTEFIPDSNSEQILLQMEQYFGQGFVPVFMPPEQALSVELNIRNREIQFGDELNSVIILSNNSTEPIIISDKGLFRGNIRIDVDVSGDLHKQIPKLISTRIRKAFLIKPGSSMLIPVKLINRDLRKMLMTYPQASLNIEFILYIDPVQNALGNTTNRLTYIAPVRVQVKRPAKEITGQYLRSRFNAISTGQVGQKIQTSQLFTGLLLELHAMSKEQLPYEFMTADWMEAMLKSGLIYESGLLRNPENGGWLIKLYTMADLLLLPLDYELLEAISENLKSAKWPVRLMALYLLDKNSGPDFKKVMDWVATNDQNEFVRNMAVVLSKSRSQKL